MNSFKAAADAACNICLVSGKKLTRDHVPPSGALGGRMAVQVRQPLREQLVDRDPRLPTHIVSKTGVYFTTVCEDCHRKLSTYDDALKQFVENAKRGLKYRSLVFDSVCVEAKPDAVIRSILAHNLTSRFQSSQSVFERQIRSIVKDEDLSAGKTLFLYVWQYSGNDIFMMHDFVVPRSNLRMPVGSVLSFPPLTFFLACQEIDGVKGMNVEDHLRTPRDRMIVNLHSDPSGMWPRSAGAIMGGAAMAEFIQAE